MRDTMRAALGDTVGDLLRAGIKTSFTEKDLHNLGVEIPPVTFSPEKIKKLRSEMKLSQAVFAKLLNVSPSAVRQWEQGKRKPSGSTEVLLELLERNPSILEYRMAA